jgi:anthranilate phosphoribosyltransferase
MSELARRTAELRRGGPLDRERAREILALLLSGAEAEAEIRALLLAVNERGVDEQALFGFAEGLREKAVNVRVDREPLVDTCGTGGDGLQTFNISTAAALVAAGAGLAVAKHGNRSVSSRSGSADVLEALGVPVAEPPEAVRASIEELGFGFFFAPRYHPAMKHVGPARKALGVRTFFNLLGPLANPALVRRQVVGVYDPELLETYARVLLRLGAQRVLVVRGEDGMDELSLAAPTRICSAEAGGAVRVETVSPEDAGLLRCAPAALRGGDAVENARELEALLGGRPGPLLDAVLLNAAAAFLVAGLAADLREGVAQARASVASGRAMAVLEGLRARRREDR